MSRNHGSLGRTAGTRILLSVWVLSAVFLSACGGRKKPVQPPVQSTLGPGEENYSSELAGTASFYGEQHNGRPTADGEIFDKHALTAAHRTLPFNTRVRVINLQNHKSVVVRINDRGPYVAGRIIDLSEEAARRIGMIGPGTARVRLEILSAPFETGVIYAVQVGAFANKKNADRLLHQLADRYVQVTVTPYRSSEGVVYRVRVGSENSLSKANELAHRLQKERLSGMVVRRDAP